MRRQVAAVLRLRELEDLAWQSELIVTEVTGNVVRHGKTVWFELRREH